MNVDQDRESFLERATRGVISLLGPGGGLVSVLLEKKVPNAAVQDVRSDMFLGEGRYGGLSPAQRAVMGRILVSTAINTEGSGESLVLGEASAKANDIFEEAEKRFISEEFGLIGGPAKQVGGLMFNSGPPATEPRQQTDITGVADPIRRMLSSGLTVEEVEEFARTQPNFSQSAFDRALAAIAGAQ